MGIDYEYLLYKDVKFLKLCIDGHIQSREEKLNDLQSLIPLLAVKIMQAYSGSKDFSKPLEPITLHELTEEEKMQRLVNESLASLKDKF